MVSRDSLAQAFGNQEIDAFNLNGSADDLKTVQGRGDATVLRSLGPVYRHVTLNGTSQVFSNPAVREAFATALDRELLATAILSPVGSPAATLGNLIYLPGQKGYVDHTEALTGQAADARTILEDAGATFDGDAATLDGNPLAVRFVIPSDKQNSANIANLVTQQTAAAGFVVTIDTVPSADFFTRYITTEDRNVDATCFAWQGTPFPGRLHPVDLLPVGLRAELPRRHRRLARRRLGGGERRVRRRRAHRPGERHRREARRAAHHHPPVRRAVRVRGRGDAGELRPVAVRGGPLAGRGVHRLTGRRRRCRASLVSPP